jgi:undecaprenyl-diphosphatase
MFPLMLVVAGYLYWKKRITTALFWVSALAISEALLWTSKFIYARPRPPMSLVQTHGYSFPSGHANTAATVALGIALLLAIRRSRHWYFEILAVMYIATIAWSRVYLRAHWLSDVFTGAALGAAVVVTAFLAVSSLERRGRLPAGDHPNPTT